MHHYNSAKWLFVAMLFAISEQAQTQAEPDLFNAESVEAWLQDLERQSQLVQPPSAYTIEHWPDLHSYQPQQATTRYNLGALTIDTKSREPVRMRAIADYRPYQSPTAFADNPVQHTRLSLSDPNLWPTYIVNEKDKNWLDATRDYLHQTAKEPVIWFDNFFAVKRAPKKASHDLRLTPKFDCSDIEACEFSFAVRSRVTLPHTQQRLRLLLTNEDPDTLFDTLDRRSVTPAQSDKRNPISAALSWALRTTDDYNIAISTGLQLRTPVRAFVQASSTGRLKLTEKAQLTGGQSVFYRSDEGAGARTQIDMDHTLRDERSEVLRWRQRYDVSEVFTGVNWGTSVEYLHQVNRDLAWGIGAATKGNIDQAALAEEHRVWARYRKRFYREWLFWEVQPYVRWNREFDFKPDPGVELSLEIYLDEEP